MSERKTIAHRTLMLAALTISLTTLPFSLKVCHAGMIVLLASWFFEGHWGDKLRILSRSILLQIILALFFLQVIGVAYSDNTTTGWFSIEKKIFFLLIPVALATTAIKLSEREIKLILYSFVLSCFIGSLLCILHAWDQVNLIMAGKASLNQYLSTSAYHDLHPFNSEKWLIFSYVSLSEGINIHPTYFSLYLGFCIIFLLHQLHRVQSPVTRTGFWILASYFALFIIFLASRIMILSLSVIFILVLVRSLMNKQRSVATALIIISFLFVGLLFINPVSRYRNLQEINLSTFEIGPGNTYKNAAQIRLSLWWLSIRSLKQTNPVWGTGSGDVEKLMEQTSNQYNIANVLGSFDPHNQYLFTLLANGITGFLLLILCLGLPGYFAWAQKDYLLLGLSCLFALLCFTESALELQKGIGFYTLFVSLLAFQYNSFQNITLNSRFMFRAAN